MTEERFDIAIKIDAKVSAVQLIEIILELDNFVCWFNMNNIEWDENYIYIEGQYEESDEKDLLAYLEQSEYASADYDTMRCLD